MRKDVFVVEVDRCIGCKACMVACKQGNNVPLGTYRNRTKQVGPLGVYPNVEMYFLQTMCQQCENPACVAVCPTGACFKRDEDGIVVIDRDKCIGCRSCEKACPYELNTYNEELMVMDKCDTCYKRRAEGKRSYCEDICPGECLHIGDINDPDSEVSRMVKEAGDKAFRLPDKDGVEPNIIYILKNDEWQSLLPKECRDTMRGDGR
ncbi:MAG: 4Fe-4S dicluster domain-containing protein [Eubacterium sp.]|nr:4Fe-4S dicluster domain-containing protein [Eubacterium sp.]